MELESNDVGDEVEGGEKGWMMRGVSKERGGGVELGWKHRKMKGNVRGGCEKTKTERKERERKDERRGKIKWSAEE